jgi:flagellar M-ring protein FliF
LQNLFSIWAGLSNARRGIVIGATIAMFLAILGVARISNQGTMALLYSGLDAAAAGEVIAALDQQGIAYQVDGSAIYVDSAQRDSLRMTLAAQGLPSSTGSGYELLDNLSGIGTTSQMFDAAYWRAKEGEIARTLLAMPEVRSARVHIAEAPGDLFQDRAKPTASVTITTRSTPLTGDQAKAIRHLVSGAVAGMGPEDVQVIDSVAGLIPNEDADGASNPSGDARAAEIKKNVERLLAARVGAGNAVVEVSVDVVTDREEVTSRTLDPQGRIAISTETASKSDSSTGSDPNVTVASNLPNGATGGASNQSQSNDSSERVNYDVSETKSQLVKMPGAIKKLSVAVLVDQERVVAEDGTVTFQPRSDQELADLKDLVSSAVGYDQTRGDVLTLKSMPFQQPLAEGTLAESSLFSAFGPINAMSLIQLAVLSIVALVLGLFVLRPILASGRGLNALEADGSPLALPGGLGGMGAGAMGGGGLGGGGMGGGFGGGSALTGEIDDGMFPMPAVADFAEQEAAMTGIETDPVARLRRLIEERQSESLEILRSWMETDEETA